MSERIHEILLVVMGALLGGFLVYVFTLPEPKHDEEEFGCPKVIQVSEKPFGWYQMNSQIWWDNAEPVGFSPYGSSYICLFEKG